MVSGPATDEKTASAVGAMIRQQGSVGAVPDEWLSRDTYALGDIKQVINELCAVLEKRQPPPTVTQHEMLTKKFWPLEEGRASETANQQSNPSTR